jgi:hypothetical protein
MEPYPGALPYRPALFWVSMGRNSSGVKQIGILNLCAGGLVEQRFTALEHEQPE